MELHEPKRKRRVRVKPQQPFPIPIESFTESAEVLTFKNVWRNYTGRYSGNNVIVDNEEDMKALHTMGFFGKGSLSRSAPTFGKWKTDVPPLIYNRQWKRRCKWAEAHKKSIQNDQYYTAPANKYEDSSEIPTVQNCIGREENIMKNAIISENEQTFGRNHRQAEGALREEIVDLDDDDDDIVMINSTFKLGHIVHKNIKPSVGGPHNSQKSSEDKIKEIPLITLECDEVNGKILKESENDNQEGPSVIVLADSDCDVDDEDYIIRLSPRLEQEKFPIREALHLTLEEAFFLSYGLGCFQIVDMFGNELSLIQMWRLFCESQADFIEKYVAYHYFRAKGWVVKPGLKFGGDFLLYKHGPPFYHASYIVLVDVVTASGIWNKPPLSWTRFIGLSRLSDTAGKEVLVCHVVWPSEVPFNGIKSPKVLDKFTVQEVLMRRWVSSQEREEQDNEENIG